MGIRCARIARSMGRRWKKEEEDHDDEDDEEEEQRTCTWDDGVTGAARDMNYAGCWR